jgi:hypothetical protein
MKVIVWMILALIFVAPATILYYTLFHSIVMLLSVQAWVQVAIVVGTGLTAYMVASKSRPVRRVGFAIGVCSQPFWFMASYWSGQWGVCLTCFWYVFCHGRGFVNTKN